MQQKIFEKIAGVLVFLEKKSSREYVGILKKIDGGFYFEYDMKYLKSKDVISLGPEMPLTKQTYKSTTLFVPFADRIPSKENPAYADYCRTTGISVNEINPLVLLSTIAHRGPSSFIFEPFYDECFTSEDFLNFRKNLGLTVKEFCICFGFSSAAVTRIELKQSSGREVLKRAEIYAHYPEVALDQIKRHGVFLHTSKRIKAESWLRSLMTKT